MRNVRNGTAMIENRSSKTTVGRPVGHRSVGWSAAAAGALIAAGAAAELVYSPQQPDGTVVEPAWFALLVTTAASGAALLTYAAWGLRGLVDPPRRAVRWGSGIATVGAALLLAAMLAVLVTGLAFGQPEELSFVPFALGLLLLAVGPVVLGVGLRRELPVVGGALVVAGLASFAAGAIPLDPWHDVSLMAMCGAWVLAGVLLVRR